MHSPEREVMDTVFLPPMPQDITAVPFRREQSKPLSASTTAAKTDSSGGSTEPPPTISTASGACSIPMPSAATTSLQKAALLPKYAAAPLSPEIITDTKTPPKKPSGVIISRYGVYNTLINCNLPVECCAFDEAQTPLRIPLMGMRFCCAKPLRLPLFPYIHF